MNYRTPGTTTPEISHRRYTVHGHMYSHKCHANKSRWWKPAKFVSPGPQRAAERGPFECSRQQVVQLRKGRTKVSFTGAYHLIFTCQYGSVGYLLGRRRQRHELGGRVPVGGDYRDIGPTPWLAVAGCHLFARSPEPEGGMKGEGEGP